MKSLKLVCMAMVSMAVILVSCSGSDGETGPQGPAGAAGADGINGVDGADGADGVDGNANVQEHTFMLDTFGNYTKLLLDLNNIVDEPANYAYLYYLVAPDPEDEEKEYRISIPGALGIMNVDVSVWTDLSTGDLLVGFFQDGNPYQIDGSPFPKLIVIAIELTNTSKTSESVIKELKTAGVDTSDYNAVAEYFGLE